MEIKINNNKANLEELNECMEAEQNREERTSFEKFCIGKVSEMINVISRF